jgi:hypothetical protein
VLGASNKYSAEEQLDQISLYWINLNGGHPVGLTVHIVSCDRDLTFDINEGSRIPKAAERHAKTVEDLRAAGIGIRRVLLAHDGTTASHDVFEWMLTMVAPEVGLDMVPVMPAEAVPSIDPQAMKKDQDRAIQLGRLVQVLANAPQNGPEIVQLAKSGGYDVLVLPWPQTWSPTGGNGDNWINHVKQHAPCSVFMAAHPVIPRVAVAD